MNDFFFSFKNYFIIYKVIYIYLVYPLLCKKKTQTIIQNYTSLINIFIQNVIHGNYLINNITTDL